MRVRLVQVRDVHGHVVGIRLFGNAVVAPGRELPAVGLQSDLDALRSKRVREKQPHQANENSQEYTLLARHGKLSFQEYRCRSAGKGFSYISGPTSNKVAPFVCIS
jgi:hypothetical protein